MEDALVATLTVQNSHTIFRVSFEFLNFMGLLGTSWDFTGRHGSWGYEKRTAGHGTRFPSQHGEANAGMPSPMGHHPQLVLGGYPPNSDNWDLLIQVGYGT